MRKKSVITVLVGIALNAALGTLHAQWQTSGSNIYYNSGNVGIGTSNIYTSFHVKSNRTDAWSIISEARDNRRVIGMNHTGNFGVIGVSYLNNEGFTPLQLQTSNLPRITILTNGDVGIGTTNPTAKLHVAGNTYLGGTASIGRSATHYDEFGFNIGFTGTSDSYTYRSSDYAASIRMGHSGSITFRTAPSGTAGNALTLTERMRITLDGNVGIGTTSPIHKLTVAGAIGAREIIVNPNMGADFVFENDYRLRPLAEVEEFITENKHLPDIAPADEMIENGLSVGEFQIQLLQKIEELTLYIIELEKRLSEIETNK